MIDFDLDELLDALELCARSERLAARRDREAMQAATAEAEILAAGKRENEIPAILTAFGRRTALFGPAGRSFVRCLVRAHAVALGFELELNEVELEILFARVVLGKIHPFELRGWCEARLRPLGQRTKRSPPKRPR